MIRITVNGEKMERAPGTTLGALIESLDLAPGRVAVELDGEIIRSPEWAQTALESGARIEIVQFLGGG